MAAVIPCEVETSQALGRLRDDAPRGLVLRQVRDDRNRLAAAGRDLGGDRPALARSMSTTATAAPSDANLRAPALPMPDAPAVTMPSLPASRPMPHSIAVALQIG